MQALMETVPRPILLKSSVIWLSVMLRYSSQVSCLVIFEATIEVLRPARRSGFVARCWTNSIDRQFIHSWSNRTSFFFMTVTTARQSFMASWTLVASNSDRPHVLKTFSSVPLSFRHLSKSAVNNFRLISRNNSEPTLWLSVICITYFANFSRIIIGFFQYTEPRKRSSNPLRSPEIIMLIIRRPKYAKKCDRTTFFRVQIYKEAIEIIGIPYTFEYILFIFICI